MGKKLRALLLMLVVVTYIGSSVPTAIAQTEDTGTSDEMLQTTALENEPTDDKATGREARVKSYKEKAAASKLTEVKAKRIASRCKSAQGKVTALRARVNSVVANRKKVYQEVGDKLDVLLQKLVAAEMDTTTLETARADMRAELATLTESLNSYDTVLADLEAMDCEADPDSFQAALSSAREIQTALRTQAQEFRRFATTELKTILQDVRTQLAAKQGSLDQPQTTEGGN